jgi:hypothetical protein
VVNIPCIMGKAGWPANPVTITIEHYCLIRQKYTYTLFSLYFPSHKQEGK